MVQMDRIYQEQTASSENSVFMLVKLIAGAWSEVG